MNYQTLKFNVIVSLNKYLFKFKCELGHLCFFIK